MQTETLWIDSAGKRVNYEQIRNQRAKDGSLHPGGLMPEQLNELGYQEITTSVKPDDFSDKLYFRTEQDDAPYVIYTRKPQEMIDAATYNDGMAKIKAMESDELMPRTLREFLLEQPGAAQKPWFAKINKIHQDIEAIKATLPPKPATP